MWKIISGGQTGVDRAALDAARALALLYGGFIPKGRRTEDGGLPAVYAGMTETGSGNYPERTRRNIEAADATLILTRGALDRGTELTLRTAEAKGKPVLVVDLAATPADAAAADILAWLRARPAGTLNVAGPRESRQPGIQAEAQRLLTRVLTELTAD
jgi:hypothetical protein